MNTTSNQITFLLDRDDLACLEALRPQALAGRLMVLDLDLHLHLLDRGMIHLTPWDIVRPDEYEELVRFEAEVLAFWERTAHAWYDGLDCLRLARYRHMCCFTRLAWVAYVIRRTLQTLGPREVVTFEETSGHGLDQPAGYRKMPLLFTLVRGMAEQAGIAVHLLRRGALPAYAEFKDEVAAATAVRLAPISPQGVLRGRPYVLFAGSGVDLLRQLPAIRELRRRDGFAVAQLYKSADESTLQALRREGHPLWHESQVASDASRIADCGLRLGMAEARRDFDRRRADAPPELRGIFANRFMNLHFDFIFGAYLERMARHVRVWKGFFARHRPAILVANYPAPIIDVAHHLGIPCLVLTHGLMILGDGRLYQGQPPARMGAVSDAHASRLVTAGIKPDRIHVIGDPGADEVMNRAARSRSETALAGPDARRPGRRVLFVTGELSAPSAKACLPEVDFAAAARCWDQLAELIRRRPDWECAIKCHPRYDHPALYDRLNRRISAARRIPVFIDGPLDDLVRHAEVAVFPNARSSALIEASMWGKPVIILDTCMIWFDHSLWGTDRWPRARSVADLERELEAMFGDPYRYRDRVAQTRQALAYCLGDEPPRSAERCADWIERLAV